MNGMPFMQTAHAMDVTRLGARLVDLFCLPDIGEITTFSNPTNCYHNNIEQGGGQVTSSPAGLEQSKPVCDRHSVPGNDNAAMTNDIVCDSQAFAGLAPGVNSTPCTPGTFYPRKTGVPMPPVPRGLKSMPNPCKGVPANPWCRK